MPKWAGHGVAGGSWVTTEAGTVAPPWTLSAPLHIASGEGVFCLTFCSFQDTPKGRGDPGSAGMV